MLQDNNHNVENTVISNVENKKIKDSYSEENGGGVIGTNRFFILSFWRWPVYSCASSAVQTDIGGLE